MIMVMVALMRSVSNGCDTLKQFEPCPSNLWFTLVNDGHDDQLVLKWILHVLLIQFDN